MHKMKMMSVDDLRLGDLDVTFPAPPTRKQAEKWLLINEAAKIFAKTIIETVPWSCDRDRSQEAIREAVMWAKEAILTWESTQIPSQESQAIWRDV